MSRSEHLAKIRPLAEAERRRRSLVRDMLAQGRLPLAACVEDPAIKSLTVLRVLAVCITTRHAHLDTRRWINAQPPAHVNRLLAELDLTGAERMSSLRARGRAAVAARLEAHRKATWHLRTEQDTGRNPIERWH